MKLLALLQPTQIYSLLQIQLPRRLSCNINSILQLLRRARERARKNIRSRVREPCGKWIFLESQVSYKYNSME